MHVPTEPELNHSNQNATFLKIRCKKSDDTLEPGTTEAIFKGVGFAPAEWQHPDGNVIVARVDKKPPEIETMRILCDFCAVRMMRLFREALGMGNLEEMGKSDEEMQAKIHCEFTRKAFRVYREEYETREVKNGRPFHWDGTLRGL
jgi:hypothetical protein